MSYINVGAFIRDGGGDVRPRSKKALATALKDTPSTVSFDITSPLGPNPDYFHRGLVNAAGLAKLLNGDKLTVCGPDPFENRKWFGTIEAIRDSLKFS